ncbi:hypothetical protein KCU92_g196, partial [Aureobasidium melanogenum]
MKSDLTLCDISISSRPILAVITSQNALRPSNIRLLACGNKAPSFLPSADLVDLLRLWKEESFAPRPLMDVKDVDCMSTKPEPSELFGNLSMWWCEIGWYQSIGCSKDRAGLGHIFLIVGPVNCIRGTAGSFCVASKKLSIQEQNTVRTDRRPNVICGRLHRITRDLISEFERIFLLLRDQAGRTISGVIGVLLLVVSATIEFRVRPVVNSAFSSSNLCCRVNCSTMCSEDSIPSELAISVA